MINIDDVRKKPYAFPTIDFKFQNTGSAAAFLWKFQIIVIEAHIDRTPVLKFHAGVERGEFQVSVSNHGWGAAHDCLITFDEPLITQLFEQAARTFKGTIESGAQVNAVRLTANLAAPEKVKALEHRFVALDLRDDDNYYNRGDRNQLKTNGIRLGEGSVNWAFNDETGTGSNSETNLYLNDLGHFAFTPDRFIEVTYTLPPPCIQFSDVTYATLINPAIGAHERSFPISRKVPPGDVERFHILIGSSQSCRLRIQFKFFIDTATIISSKEFDIAIWNPRDSALHLEYEDGSELARKINEVKTQIEKGSYRTSYRGLTLDELQRQASDYPFVKTDGSRW